MPRAFGSSSDKLSNAALSVVAGTVGSFAFWFRPNWNGGDGTIHVVGGYYGGVSAGSGSLDFQQFSDNNIYAGWFGFSADARVKIASTSARFTNGVWRHYCLAWDTSGSELFIDGVSVGTSATSTTGNTGSVPAKVLGQYGDTGSASTLNGTLAEWARWTRKLNAQDAALLAAGLSPLRLFGCIEYTPLNSLGGSEPDLCDPKGALTIASTTVSMQWPPIEQSRFDDWFDRAIAPPPSFVDKGRMLQMFLG
jgi:hypothetical protein